MPRLLLPLHQEKPSNHVFLQHCLVFAGGSVSICSAIPIWYQTIGSILYVTHTVQHNRTQILNKQTADMTVKPPTINYWLKIKLWENRVHIGRYAMMILLMQALCNVRWYVSNAILGFLAASAGTPEQWVQPRLPDPKVGSMHNMQRSQERRRLCVVVFGAKRPHTKFIPSSPLLSPISPGDTYYSGTLKHLLTQIGAMKYRISF